LIYQCRTLTSSHRTEANGRVIELNRVINREVASRGFLGFGSTHDIRQRFDFPYTIRINHLLVEGTNFIDIHSENSGTAGCLVDTTLQFQNTNSLEKDFRVRIEPNNGSSPRDKDLQPDEVFYSGGATLLSDQPNKVEPYDTFRAYHLFRVCERIRIGFTLTGDQMRNLSPEPEFDQWAIIRVMLAQCNLLFFGQSALLRRPASRLGHEKLHRGGSE
jgi:hypothetical protein